MTETSSSQAPPILRVLATSACFQPGSRGGGPIRSLAYIVDTTSDQVEILLLTRDRDLGVSEPYPDLSGRWVKRSRTRVFYVDVTSLRQWVRFRQSMNGTQVDLLYVNSLLDPTFSIIPILATALGLIRPTRILVAPRGELSPGALALKSRKKSVFIKVWAPVLRMLGASFHATNAQEAAAISRHFTYSSVRIVEEQTSLPADPIRPELRPGPARWVFISRISPMKRLDLALTALRSCTEQVSLDIFGPIEDARHWESCLEIIEDLPLNVSVDYCGELEPDLVASTFGEYDAFIFPTAGESFGHVIAESLFAGCPVICSAETPWTELLRNGGGAVIDPMTSDALSSYLDALARLDSSSRLQARRDAASAYLKWRAVRKENPLDSFLTHPW